MKVTVNIKAKHIELAKGMLMQAADTDEEVNKLNETIDALRDKTIETDLDFLKDKDNGQEVECIHQVGTPDYANPNLNDKIERNIVAQNGKIKDYFFDIQSIDWSLYE